MSPHHVPTIADARDPYRGLVVGLFALCVLGGIAAVVIGALAPAVFEATLMFALAAAVLYGVSAAQRLRAGWQPPFAPSGPGERRSALRRRPSPTEYLGSLQRFVGAVGLAVVAAGVALLAGTASAASSLRVTIVATAFACVAAGFSVLAARYFARIDDAALPEAGLLARMARGGAWGFAGLALAEVTSTAAVHTVAVAVRAAIALVLAATCLELARSRATEVRFAGRLRVLELIGARANLLASVLDGMERGLGIDLRSTWALAYLRRRLLPLVGALAVLGWLSTSVSVVARDEHALLERLGVPADGSPLSAGLHLHFPAPIDRLVRVQVQAVRAIAIGHEDEAPGGAENVLWARQHAAKEYTLLVGEGRDLLTVDAALQFRISDARAWTYHARNPTDALRASAYRAVMRATANRTLEATLSENVTQLTAQIAADIQRSADALGLGVEVVGFTVGGMHPPVAVASDYEAVVSAELGQETAIVEARAARNTALPNAEAERFENVHRARAEAAGARAEAAGSAWSFRALEARYRADPAEYRFRTRLEALERGLAGRHFTIVDARILRDGGGLWLNQ